MMETSNKSSSGQHSNSTTLGDVKTEQDTSNGNISPSMQNPSGNQRANSPAPPQPFQNPQNILIDNEEVYSVEGMQYCGDSSGYNSQDFGDVFSCDDLYAVMDSSNREGAVIAAGDPVNWQACGLISIGSSDIRQLHVSAATPDDQSASAGGEIGTSGYMSNGSFYRLISLHGVGESSGTGTTCLSEESGSPVITSGENCPSRENLSSSSSGGDGSSGRGSNGSTSATTNNNENSQSEAYASPAAGITVPMDTSANTATATGGAQVKVRKPRGRKPKIVKEAEAAAAAAAASGTSSGNNGDRGVSSPTMNASAAPLRPSLIEVVGGYAEESNVNAGMQERGGDCQLQQQLECDASGPQSPRPQYKSGSIPAPQPPLNKFSQQQRSAGGQGPPGQMSLEQLAYHDRRVILMTRMPNIRPNNIAPSEQPHYVNQGYYLNGAQQRSPAQSPPRRPVNVIPTPHPRYAKATFNPGGRLDQLFSSRIAAPSSKSIVKPKIIQENRSIYNLLTRPTTPRPASSGFDNRKLSQERWMQCPNPSIFPEDNESCENGVNSGNRANDAHPPLSNADTGLGNSTPVAAVESCPSSFLSNHPQQRRPYLPTNDNPLHLPSVGSRVILGNGHGGVNIRRDGASERACSSCRPQPTLHSRSSTSSTMSSFNRGRSTNTGSGYLHSNQIQDLQAQLETMAQDNYEYRCRTHYLSKVNKHLMTRLRHAYEQSEAWKTYAQQSAQFYGDGNYGVSGGNLRNSPMPGSLYSPFMDDNFMMRGVGEMSGGSNVNLHAGSRDVARDDEEPTYWHSQRNNQSGNNYNRRDERLLFEDDDTSTTASVGRSLAGGSLKRLREAALQNDLQSCKKVCSSAVAGPAFESFAEDARRDAASGEKGQCSVASNRGEGERESSNELDMRSLITKGNEDENTGGNDGSDTSPNAATEVVVAEDGENTTSTLFPSPCSVGSLVSGSSTSISSSSSQLNDFSAFGNLVGVKNDLSASKANVNVEERVEKPVDNFTTTKELGS